VISGKLTSIFIAVLVVLCPLRCTLAGYQADPSVDMPSTGCSCCQRDLPPADTSDPQPPSPGDSPGADCLCGGALLVSEAKPQAASDVAFAGGIPASTPGVVDQILAPSRVIRRSAPIPVAATAAATRAVLSCWIL
jgi:hypothetical protein